MLLTNRTKCSLSTIFFIYVLDGGRHFSSIWLTYPLLIDMFYSENIRKVIVWLIFVKNSIFSSDHIPEFYLFHKSLSINLSSEKPIFIFVFFNYLPPCLSFRFTFCYFWDIYYLNLWEENFGRGMVSSCWTNVLLRKKSF